MAQANPRKIVELGGGEAPLLDLFVLAYAGGRVQAFRDWARHLPAAVSLYGLELGGHGVRSADIRPRHVTEVVDDLLPALAKRAVHTGRPFVLYGHSMGALVAFELCHALQARGEVLPLGLLVSGHASPEVAAKRNDTLHLAGDAALLERLKSWGGTPAELLDSAVVLERILPLLRDDLSICETYRPPAREPLPLPILAYCGERDDTEPVEGMRDWQRHAGGGFRLSTFEGGHFFCIEEGNASFLQCLERDLRAFCALALKGWRAPVRPDAGAPATRASLIS